eukprot:Gregarina_sp_Poly_1__2407@NODE_1645_length_3631_cov_7_561728_g1085_i0_p4_GENE_NODE_1645_length_3631_cov_7_561728_g1085_i0NODE_1645_length_3631_cov_7_561728_g1085_i0_p4_ORF_typecomplete_len102_score1_75_NODE_1645_length_3631_cov_7_561728_g1085_i0215520
MLSELRSVWNEHIVFLKIWVAGWLGVISETSVFCELTGGAIPPANFASPPFVACRVCPATPHLTINAHQPVSTLCSRGRCQEPSSPNSYLHSGRNLLIIND